MNDPSHTDRRQLLAAGLVVLTTGCGGAGAGAAPSPAPVPAPADPPTLPPMASRAPLYQPKDGKRLLFLGQDMVALGGIRHGSRVYANGYLDDTELSRLPVGLTTYLQVSDSQGLTTTFHNDGEEKNAELTATAPAFAGSRPLLAIGYFVDTNYAATLNGSRDMHIKALAAWIKAKNLPVFLRIGYEFNADWAGHSRNRQGFIEVYRYIVSKIQSEGARQVAFVWQSDGQGTPTELASYYPGDAYVDWMGYSHFNNFGQGLLAFARSRGKPVMVAEATPVGFDLGKAGDADGQRVWDAWFQPLLNHVQANPEIQALAYINDRWPAKAMWANNTFFNTTDSRIQQSPYVRARWLSALQEPAWLTRSEVLAGIGI